MSLWHADTSSSTLDAGARLLVFSPHRVVHVATADELVIDTRIGGRLNALVLDRTEGQLELSLPDGEPIVLSLVSDSSLAETQDGLDFSRQLWVVN